MVETICKRRLESGKTMQKTEKIIVIAVGGNSLIKSEQEGSIEEQYQNAHTTCKQVIELVKEGYKVVITHGNGPQVGNIFLRVENTRNITYNIPLDYCGAMSQGLLGYLLSNVLEEYIRAENLEIPVDTIITRTVVDKNDPAFQNPTKPIGKFYSEKEAVSLAQQFGYIMKEDSGRGYRQVVCSPTPVNILELAAIKALASEGHIVVSCGGGGVPVIVHEDGKISGVEAVIDKDMTSSMLASKIGAETLLISTAVDNVYINFGTENQKALGLVTTQELKTHLNNDEFKSGSMKPKIIAALNFINSGGKKAIITSPENILKTVKNTGIGTHIVNKI